MAVSLQQSLPEMAKKGKNPDDDANDADDATTDRQSQQASILVHVAAQIILVLVDKICLIFKRKIRVVASLIT